MRIGAIVLAAGSGSRIGHRAKALLELDGVPLIRRQLTALALCAVDDVVIVLGHYAAAIEAVLREARFGPTGKFTLVPNPTPDDGQPSSLRIGLRSLDAGLDAVIIALADQPLIEAQDVGTLIGAFEQRGAASMLVPRVRDPRGAWVPGNPVIIDAAVRAEWLADDPNAAGRRWRERNPQRVCWFDTDNPRYVTDIDTPDDLRSFVERTGRSLRWPAGL